MIPIYLQSLHQKGKKRRKELKGRKEAMKGRYEWMFKRMKRMNRKVKGRNRGMAENTSKNFQLLYLW